MLQEEHLGDLSQKVEEAFQHREAIANKLKSINAIERERLVDVVLQMIGRGA